MRPHLLKGFKYDLRLYVLITCFEPLTIYLYKDGLVRFATQPYNTKNKIRFAHLTNFSVNKKSSNYKKNVDKGNGEDEGTNNGDDFNSKWSIKALRKAFSENGIHYDKVFARIKELIIKAIISVESPIVNNLNRSTKHRRLCFEVYGFDVLLD